jgi:hypothetical protein
MRDTFNLVHLEFCDAPIKFSEGFAIAFSLCAHSKFDVAGGWLERGRKSQYARYGTVDKSGQLVTGCP